MNADAGKKLLEKASDAIEATLQATVDHPLKHKCDFCGADMTVPEPRHSSQCPSIALSKAAEELGRFLDGRPPRCDDCGSTAGVVKLAEDPERHVCADCLGD